MLFPTCDSYGLWVKSQPTHSVFPTWTDPVSQSLLWNRHKALWQESSSPDWLDSRDWFLHGIISSAVGSEGCCVLTSPQWEQKDGHEWVAALMAIEEGEKQRRPNVVNQAWLARGCLGYRDSLRVAITAVTPHDKHSFVPWMYPSWRKRNPRLVDLFRSSSKISHLAHLKLLVEIFFSCFSFCLDNHLSLHTYRFYRG